ncbi:MAG: DegT/DnrJ/EryC1/StrS family aminotransferase [Clostridiaceae bacterium]|nr:DegT/DnrJ/EryC1/StrS family aminotransferase [Clostridiaceae bacterium]
MYRIGREEIEAVAKVIESGCMFSASSALQEVNKFQREWAEYLGVNYSILVSGGTAALTCALVGMGIGPGDEVIVPAYPFMATALAVTSVGAIPVLAEVDETLTIDLNDVEKKLTPNVKAVIPVAIVGFPCEMDRLMTMARQHNFLVLEDACQADGGSYKGKRLGSWGDAGAFSFNDYKIISAGEGGAVVTDDRQIYERALIHHDGGAAFRPYAGELTTPVFMGTQYRVSEITGAIMRVQLGRLDGILRDLRRVKAEIMRGLAGTDGICFNPSHDLDGDCGTTLPFLFDTEKRARDFAAKISAVTPWLPIDSGKHVYANWSPMLERRGACHPAMNPYNMEANRHLRTTYAPDMCPQTLDLLSRTVFISLQPNWSAERIDSIVREVRDAVTKL